MTKNTTYETIDTLYLQARLDYPDYREHLLKVAETEKHIGYAKGYDFYQAKNYRIGFIHDYEKTQISKQFHIVVQYENDYIATLTAGETPPPPLDKNIQWNIQRLDYNVTTTDTKYREIMQECNFLSDKFKRHERIIGTSGRIETYYLGSRSSGKYFRIYDKKKELRDKKNIEKRTRLIEKFGTDDLISYEIELHRKHLLTRGILPYLSNIAAIIEYARSILGSIQYYKNTEANNRRVRNNNRSRVERKYLNDMRITFVPESQIQKRVKNSDAFADSITQLIDRHMELSPEDTYEDIMLKIFNKTKIYSNLEYVKNY